MFEFVDVKYKNIIDIKTLQISEKKITTLIGPSGSGKTTILRMLNKMISPTQGSLLYNRVHLQKIDSITHRREVTMLSQNPAMFEGSIRDNLNAGLIFQGKELLNDSILKDTLEQVKLEKDLDLPANNLSGGEKQRLALGRIMVLNPKVLLLDEPSSALDDATEDSLIQTIIEYVKKNNKTIVMVTHSKEIANKYSDVIIEIGEGKNIRRLSHEGNY
jgi:putative ABC transport system ATP-binding protein